MRPALVLGGGCNRKGVGGSQVQILAVPEFIGPVFTKTSAKRSFFVLANERFGLVFAKTGSINSGTGF